MKVLNVPIVTENESVILFERNFPEEKEMEKSAKELVEYFRESLSHYTWDCMAKEFNNYWKTDDHTED